MKHFLTLFCLCLFARLSFGYPPMETKSLKERVEMSNQDFVGVIEKVIAVDDNYHEIPDAELPDISNFVLLQVRVEESLTSPDWHPSKPVIAGFGGMWVSVKEMRDTEIGSRAIYITNMVQLPHWGPVFVPSYGYFLNARVEDKGEVKKLVKVNTESGQEWNHFDRLSQTLRDAEAIHIGMTRKEVEKLKIIYNVDRPEGASEKYSFFKSPYMFVDVEFARHFPAKEDESDTVKQVSKPYIEWPPSE